MLHLPLIMLCGTMSALPQTLISGTVTTTCSPHLLLCPPAVTCWPSLPFYGTSTSSTSWHPASFNRNDCDLFYISYPSMSWKHISFDSTSLSATVQQCSATPSFFLSLHWKSFSEKVNFFVKQRQFSFTTGLVRAIKDFLQIVLLQIKQVDKISVKCIWGAKHIAPRQREEERTRQKEESRCRHVWAEKRSSKDRLCG